MQLLFMLNTTCYKSGFATSNRDMTPKSKRINRYQIRQQKKKPLKPTDNHPKKKTDPETAFDMTSRSTMDLAKNRSPLKMREVLSRRSQYYE